MYFEQALGLMREGHMISRGIPGERFRLYEGHFEIISEEYPDGCHTNVPGDDLSSDRWELADEEENITAIEESAKENYEKYSNFIEALKESHRLLEEDSEIDPMKWHKRKEELIDKIDDLIDFEE